MGKVTIPYYHVNEYGMGHWKPGKAARAAGFRNIACGKDGPAARAIAEQWNERWRKHRSAPAIVDNSRREWWEIDDEIVYPARSIGRGFQEYRQLEPWKVKSERTVEEWGRVWRHLSAYASADPNTMTLQIISEWREEIAERISPDMAFRCIKIWRALWNALAALRYCRKGDDPSLAIRNSSTPGRSQTWKHHEVVRLAKEAWRRGYPALACIIAVTWDTQMSPGDVRTLKAMNLHRDSSGPWFGTSRAKTRRQAIGTLSRQSARLLDAYLSALPFTPVRDAPLFLNRSGRMYSKNKTAEDFRYIRGLVFPGDARQLRDFRRSGAVEGWAGDVTAEEMSLKMANDLARSRSLQQTYVPNQVSIVRRVDSARIKGRRRLREGD